MKERNVRIPNVNCNHCKMTIERKLAAIKGIEKVEVNVDSKRTLICWDKSLIWEDIARILKEIGYPPEE